MQQSERDMNIELTVALEVKSCSNKRKLIERSLLLQLVVRAVVASAVDAFVHCFVIAVLGELDQQKKSSLVVQAGSK